MLRRNFLITCIFIFALSISTAYAHPGKLDENGGHVDAKTGEYHYHKGPKAVLPYDIRMNAIYKAEVVRVVDGDTAILSLKIGDGKTYKDERVRFLGVDTPETVHPNKPVEYYGKEASNFTKSQLTAGRIVWLQTDVQTRDRYNRMLAYVWLEEPNNKKLDDEAEIRAKMYNAVLLLDGYAHALTVQPNSRYSTVFAKFQSEARENNKGLWAAEQN